MKKIIFFTLVFSFILFSCNDDDCFTTQEPVVLEFVNYKGENLIQKGILTKEHFHFLQVNGDTKFGISFEINNESKVVLKKPELLEGSTFYEAIVLTKEPKLFKFIVNISKLPGKCGSNKIDNILFENIESLSQGGIHQIIFE